MEMPVKSVNMGYAVGQLLQAQASEGPTAPQKVRQWLQVLSGAQEGTLHFGSRVPVKDTPPWVTLEVAFGGFATGSFMAGGALLPFEKSLLDTIPETAPLEQSTPLPATSREEVADGAPDRRRLNAWYLSEGWGQLVEMLQTGRFRVQVPEEAAFLILVWLFRNGEEEKATELFNTISPLFPKLRFYPHPVPQSIPAVQPGTEQSSLASPPGPSLGSETAAGATAADGGVRVGQEEATGVCFVHPVKEALHRLCSMKASRELVTMREALSLWVPLKDKLADVILETVVGEAPSFQKDDSGEWVRDPQTKSPKVVGGWPGQQAPEGFAERAAAVLSECDRLPSAYFRALTEQDSRLRALVGEGEGAPQRTARSWGPSTASWQRGLYPEGREPTKPSGKKAADYVKLVDFLWKFSCASQEQVKGRPSLGLAARPGALTGREVGAVRRILAAHREKHGAPGSAERTAIRGRQAAALRVPLPNHVGLLVARRLQEAYPDLLSGAPGVQRCLGPLSSEEAALLCVHFQCRSTTPVALPLPPFPSQQSPCTTCREDTPEPRPLPPKVSRSGLCCLAAPLKTLLSSRLVASAEVLAATLPGLTAQRVAAGVADRELRRVYQAVYCAFRRRRSLLLLSLESQVRFEELPWVQVVTPWVNVTEVKGVIASLAEGTSLAIEEWPQTMFPNKLVRELQFLVSAAKSELGDVPLVEELAADIFEGQFVGKFLRAAHAAGRILKGTLYERYYGLDYDKILALDDLTELRGRYHGTPEEQLEDSEVGGPGAEKKVSPGFLQECEGLAGVTFQMWAGPAKNGPILEQAQILTTHNLAVLVCHPALGLRGTLDYWALARRCFQWVCRRYASADASPTNWRSKLHLKKNGAYAWRNMIFFLSLNASEGGAAAGTREEAPGSGADLGGEEGRGKKRDAAEFLVWAEEHLRTQPLPVITALGGYLEGLKGVVAGQDFGPDGTQGAKGVRYLGWKRKRNDRD